VSVTAGKKRLLRCAKLEHTRIIKYHTLKYVRIVKKIKYAYDTRVDKQVCRNAALYFLLTYGAVAVFETTVGIGS